MTRLEAIREALENVGDLDIMDMHNTMKRYFGRFRRRGRRGLLRTPARASR